MSTQSISLDRPGQSVVGTICDFAELTKPRIAVMVLIVVAVSMHIASFGQANPWLVLQAMLGTLGFAGSACAVNHWLESIPDRLMRRTQGRPLVIGRLSNVQALLFAGLLFLMGVLVMAWAVNLSALFWGIATWSLYVFVYTPLKTRTVANTAIGAIAGALPIFIGWSAADASLDYRAWSLFTVVFLWQFPHFMAIAWLYRKDYSNAGFQMLTTIDPSGRRAGVQAVLAALALIPVSLIPALALPNSAAVGYLIAATLLGAGQAALAGMFLWHRSEQVARWLLRASLVYLPAILILLALIPWA